MNFERTQTDHNRILWKNSASCIRTYQKLCDMLVFPHPTEVTVPVRGDAGRQVLVIHITFLLASSKWWGFWSNATNIWCTKFSLYKLYSLCWQVRGPSLHSLVWLVITSLPVGVADISWPNSSPIFQWKFNGILWADYHAQSFHQWKEKLLSLGLPISQRRPRTHYTPGTWETMS